MQIKNLFATAFSASVSLAILMCSIIFMQCSVQEESLSGWKTEPFKSINLPTNTFLVNNQTGDTLSTANGTQIVIPANCFVSTKGEVIKGDVELIYKEIHRPSEVIASGITMNHSENGVEGNLVTAGMFEFKGSHQGQEIAFAEGKAAEFSMPSMLNDATTKFYGLDTNTGKWQAKIKEVKTARIKSDLELKLEKQAPSPPSNPKNGNVIDLQFDDKRLQGFTGAFWHYAGTDQSLDPYNYPEFMEGRYTVDNYEVVEGQNLSVKVNFSFKDQSQNISKKLTTYLEPILIGSALTKAMELYEKNKVIYEQEIERAKALLATKSMDFKLTRTFRMNGFGIFNWDCFSGNPNAVMRSYGLSFDGNNIQTANIYLYRNYKNNPAMVRQNIFVGGQGRIKYSPTEKSHLLVILPDDQIGIVKASELMNLNDNDTKTLNITEMHTVENLNDIDLIIKSI